MTDAIEQFLDDLGRRGSLPLLGGLSGTLRLEVEDGDDVERWFLTFRDGEVAVSRRPAKADSTVRADREVFNGLASGRINAMSAMLRGLVELEGDVNMLILFQRAFPGPQRRAGRRKAAGQGGRRP